MAEMTARPRQQLREGVVKEWKAAQKREQDRALRQSELQARLGDGGSPDLEFTNPYIVTRWLHQS